MRSASPATAGSLKIGYAQAAARTVDALWAAIIVALDAFIPDQCVNRFTNLGYQPVDEVCWVCAVSGWRWVVRGIGKVI